MYEKQIEKIMNGEVYDRDDLDLFLHEASGISESDVEIWYDSKDNVILVGILKFILENQEELESASHLPCCGQLPENCECHRHEDLEPEDDGEYSWQGQ